MTRDQMALFDQLFEQASSIPQTERQTWLAVNCRDSEVRAELESLLPHAAPTGGFTGVIDAAAEIGRQSSLTSGHMIGPYRIVGILGEGGMGAVYEGVRDDDQFRQRVAIKVLRIGARSEMLRRRFLQERQILAELEHPNIARLFDGGTAADGSPYLVMERIDGEPLTAFAESRKLSNRQRIELFRHVASAVQYAHQRLIVHRDLKPGNILVTVGSDGRPEPKLLDFGIAKLLDAETAGNDALTATGFHLMTPDYASPEQVLGKPVTAASDIYSLGALLYELLSGTRPHGLKNYDPAEIAERICKREVAPPSAAGATALRGDLDTIVLKAMHKDPERRYNSVEQFSEDLRRYLEGRPVVARPDTTGYRVRKFVGRHWMGLGATAAVIGALSVGIGVSVHQARVARYQARLAQERFELVRTLANRFLFDFYQAIVPISGTTKAQKMVVDTAAEYLDKLNRTAASDPALWQDMAQAYLKLANVQGGQNTSTAARFEDAAVSQSRSVDFYRKLAGSDPSKRTNLAVALSRLARLELILHRTNAGLEHSNEAAGIFDVVLAANPSDGKVFYDAASVYNTIALDLLEAERPDEALPANLKAQQYQAHAKNPSVYAGRWRAVVFPQNEAKIRVQLGDVAGGIAILERVIPLLEEMSVTKPNNRELQRLTSQHLGVLADSYYSLTAMSAGDPEKSAAVHKRQWELAGRLLDSDPADGLAQMDLAAANSESAEPWIELDPRQAIQFARSALNGWDNLLKSSPGNQFATPRRASACMRLALALVRAGRPGEAIAPVGQAVETYRELGAKSPDDGVSWARLVFGLTISAQALAGAKRYEEAEQAFAEASDLGEKLQAREHSTISHTLTAAYAFDHFGDYWKSRGDIGQARRWFERSQQAWAARPEQTPAVEERKRRAQEKVSGIQS
jgi:tetratricopeptide (TPR) repeat protein